MQLNNLIRKTPNQKSVSVGRGGKRGKTSGRGTKGQNARSGRKKRPELRDFIKRFPKLRGRGVGGLKTFVPYSHVVSLASIETAFKAGESVSPETLVAHNLVSLVNGNYPKIKILSDGEITKKLTVSGCATSASAKAKIEKAGGSVR
jgi:large subunit ribosomal protein L15